MYCDIRYGKISAIQISFVCGPIFIIYYSKLTTWLAEFLGANIWDSNPFIVMPYMRNGNARDYILAKPTCDRLKLVRRTEFTSMFGY